MKILQFLQEKAVFRPIILPMEYTFHFDIPFEELFFHTSNGGHINALFFRVKNPKGVILYFHGNSKNINHWGKFAKGFTAYGYDVLVPDYRGYGKSKGERNEELMFSDAQYCYNYLLKFFDEDKITLYGRSLGGAFATKIASDNSPKNVVLEATFSSLQDMAARWMPYFLTKLVSPKMVYHFDSKEHIKKVQAPLFHFHGTKDRVVPVRLGKKLFYSFEKHQPDVHKSITIIDKGTHDDLASHERYQIEMKNILE